MDDLGPLQVLGLNENHNGTGVSGLVCGPLGCHLLGRKVLEGYSSFLRIGRSLLRLVGANEIDLISGWLVVQVAGSYRIKESWN